MIQKYSKFREVLNDSSDLANWKLGRLPVHPKQLNPIKKGVNNGIIIITRRKKYILSAILKIFKLFIFLNQTLFAKYQMIGI